MWAITRNFIGEFIKGEWQDGNGGPPVRPVQSRDFNDEKAKTAKWFKFRLYDDDGELYYEGRSTDSTTEAAFDPLDCYGKPNAGAVTIKYLSEETGEWVVL